MTAPVPIARIGKPRGVRGQVWVSLYREDLSNLLSPGSGAEVFLSGPHAPEPFRVETFFEYAAGAVLGISGVSTFEAAEKLRGREVLLPGDAVPPERPDSFDIEEVVGWVAEDAVRGEIGTICGAHRASDYWVLEVETPHGVAEVPAVAGLGVELQREARKFKMDLPSGWPLVDEPEGKARGPRED